MTQTVWAFITAIVGFLAVFGVWLAIQSLVRVYSGGSASKDTLEHLAHGCAGCKDAGACASRKAQGEQYESTGIRR